MLPARQQLDILRRGVEEIIPLEEFERKLERAVATGRPLVVKQGFDATAPDFTPVYARVGRKLIEGVRNPTVVTNDDARHAFAVRPMNLSEAIARAIRNEDRTYALTRWPPEAPGRSFPRTG